MFNNAQMDEKSYDGGDETVGLVFNTSARFNAGSQNQWQQDRSINSYGLVSFARIEPNRKRGDHSAAANQAEGGNEEGGFNTRKSSMIQPELEDKQNEQMQHMTPRTNSIKFGNNASIANESPSVTKRSSMQENNQQNISRSSSVSRRKLKDAKSNQSESTIKTRAAHQQVQAQIDEAQDADDHDMISIESDREQGTCIAECTVQKPHVHTINRCAGHSFCPVTEFEEVPNADENTTLPYPMKYDLTKISGQVQNYEKMLGNKRKAVKLEEMGLKCVVSDYALVHWYAQAFKLDVNNLPTSQDKQDKQFEHVVKYLRNFERSRKSIPERELNDHIKKSRNKGLATQSGELNDMIQQELDKKEKEMEKKDAKEIMRKMKPLVYPITRAVTKFQEFGEPKPDKKKGKKINDFDEQRQRNMTADDSLSQSSMDTGADARSLKRQGTQSKALQNQDLKKRGTMGMKEIGNFDAIVEEGSINNDMPGWAGPHKSRDLSPSLFGQQQQASGSKPGEAPGPQAALGRRQTHKSVSLRRRPPPKIDPKKRVYNPYASDGIKHFENLSRQEIDELMKKIKKDKEVRRLQQLQAQERMKSAAASAANAENTNAASNANQQEQQTVREVKNQDTTSKDRQTSLISSLPEQQPKRTVKSQSLFSRPKGQFDISMRARREQQFKDKMTAHCNVNVRQGRTYTKFFNRQLDKTDQQKGKQGTCFQYINQFQDTQVHPAHDYQTTQQHDYASNTYQQTTGSGDNKRNQPSKLNNTVALGSTKLSVHTPDRQDKIPITANLIDKLRNNRRGIKTANFTPQAYSTVGATRNTNQQLGHVNQDQALNSLMSYNNRQQPPNLNNKQLQSIINRKHRGDVHSESCFGQPPRQSSTSVNNLVTNLNQSFSEPSSVMIPRHSTSQHIVHNEGSVGGQKRIQQSARRRIKDMLDSQNLGQELRKGGRSNTITTFPYGTVNANPANRGADEITLTPLLIQDTITIEQSKMISSQRTVEDIMPKSTIISKRINQVSFGKRTATSPTKGIQLEDTLDLNYSAEKAESGSKMAIVREQSSHLSSNIKNPAKADLHANLKRGKEDAETTADEQTSQQTSKKKGGYEVQAEDYNFEVQEPSKYFQKELYVKLPLYQPEPKAGVVKNIFKCADFWLQKGFIIQNRAHQSGNRKNGNEADNVALDYYLSGVKIDSTHYGCIFNAGCCHFFTGKFQNARKWFQLATWVNPRRPDGYYGLALSCLKLGLYEEALSSIVQIDNHEDKSKTYDGSSERTSQISVSSPGMEKTGRFGDQAVTFLHAVCCKILNRQNEAQSLYGKLEEEIERQQCDKMIFSTFAVLLVPMQKERNVTEDNVNNFSKLLNLYDDEHLFDQNIATNLMRLSQPQSDMKTQKRLNYLSKYLQMFPFLRRIPAHKIEKDYIHKIQIIEKKKQDLIIIPPNNQVVIILNGQVVMREHELDTPADFNIKQIAKSGHIIFVDELDQGNSNQPLIWPVVYSQTAQYALIDRATFDQMWKDSRNRDLEVALSQLNLHVFFTTLSKQTFFKIINEKSKIMKFAPGQLVLPIHHRSPWNNEIYKKYAAKQMSVLEQLETKNDLGHGGLTALALDNKKKNPSSRLESQPNKDGAIVGTDTENGNKNAKVVMNLNKGKNETRDGAASSSKVSTIPRSMKSRSSKNEPSGYEKLVKMIGSDSKHQAQDLTTALQEKKRQAKKKYTMLAKGINLDDTSDLDMSDDDMQLSPRKGNQIQEQDDDLMPERSFCRPIMLMYAGSARCVNKSFKGSSFVAKRLATGSILGESDAMKCIGIDYFGDIYAERNGLQCLVIEKPDLCLDTFEMKILREKLGPQHHELQNMLESRFPVLRNNPIKNY